MPFWTVFFIIAPIILVLVATAVAYAKFAKDDEAGK